MDFQMGVCPYNSSHIVKCTRLANHIVKCGKQRSKFQHLTQTQDCSTDDVALSMVQIPGSSEKNVFLGLDTSLLSIEKCPQKAPQVRIVGDTGSDGLTKVKLTYYEQFCQKKNINIARQTCREKVAQWLGNLKLDPNKDNDEDDWETIWDGFQDWDLPDGRNQLKQHQHKPSSSTGNSCYHPKAVHYRSGPEKSNTANAQTKYAWPSNWKTAAQSSYTLEIDIIKDIMKKPEDRLNYH